MSQAFYLAGAYDKGVEAAQQAIHFNITNAQAYLWLGNCFRQQRKFEEAKKAYFECARLMNFDATLGLQAGVGVRICDDHAFQLETAGD